MTVVLTDTGRAEIAKRLTGASTTPFGYLGIGNGAGVPVRTDTALSADLNHWLAATLSAQTTSVPADTLQAVATYPATGTLTVTEGGLSSGSAGTPLLLHASFSPQPHLLAGDHLVLTAKLQFG